MKESSPVHNVVLFGESGVGKSSIVNLVVGSQVIETSSDVSAYTTRPRPYEVIIGGKKYRLWDTPGLDRGAFGLFRTASAEKNLRRFVRNLLKKREPSLLIYCVRAYRITRALVRHYQSLRSTIRDNAVPMVIVVTGLENWNGDMESWWQRNAVELSNHGMEFADHGCITSIDDNPCDPILARTRRASSQDTVRDLILRNCIPREQCGHNPQPLAQRHDDLRGWTWAVWTYLMSSLASGQRPR